MRQALGVHDVLAVDVCPEMLAALAERCGGAPSALGNEPGVRTWLGDVQDLPAYQVGWGGPGAAVGGSPLRQLGPMRGNGGWLGV